jgi:hypothetical protein
VVLSVLSLAAIVACVSTPVIAPTDGQIFVSGNPTAVVLDEFADPPVTSASIVVTAQLLAVNGVPLVDVSVVFTTDGGTLASAPAGQAPTPIETDDNGFVSDILTVQIGDPGAITVTVRSGGLTGALDVSKTEVGVNQPPFAIIDIDPMGTASFGQFVLYDGANSADPDSDPITCYQWQIESSATITNPALPCLPPNSRCEIVQGPGATSHTRSYGMAGVPGPTENVAVTLRITDDPSVVCSDTVALSAAAFNGLARDTHTVVCDRIAPAARVVANPSGAISLGVGPVTVTLDGSTSGGGDSGIETYAWTCAGSTSGPSNSSGVSTTCEYAAIGVYQITLTVTNACGTTDNTTLSITVIP